MGQLIEVTGTTVVGDVAVFDTDRGITGQDGAGFASAAEADAAGSFAGRLAARIFAAVDGVDRVWVASSQVVVRHPGGWEQGALAAAGDAVRRFFLFYDEV